VVRQTFQLARCGCTLRVIIITLTSQLSSTLMQTLASQLSSTVMQTLTSQLSSTLMQTLASQLSCILSLLNFHQLYANSRFSTFTNSHANSCFSTLMQTLASQLSPTLMQTLASQLSCKLSLLNSFDQHGTYRRQSEAQFLKTDIITVFWYTRLVVFRMVAKAKATDGQSEAVLQVIPLTQFTCPADTAEI
jgi:hypothetical protein